jgi:flagellar protein FlaG
MDINEVAGRASSTFLPRMPAKPAPSQPTDPETSRARDDAAVAAAAASSPGIQMQEIQPALDADPSARPQSGVEALRKAVEKIQEFIRKAASDIEFSIDEDSGRTVVKVIDRETEEIIRQIPSQEMLDLAQALDKLQGLLIKQKA